MDRQRFCQSPVHCAFPRLADSQLKGQHRHPGQVCPEVFEHLAQHRISSRRYYRFMKSMIQIGERQMIAYGYRVVLIAKIEKQLWNR